VLDLLCNTVETNIRLGTNFVCGCHFGSEVWRRGGQRSVKGVTQIPRLWIDKTRAQSARKTVVGVHY
jgi:hypothetical protein